MSGKLKMREQTSDVVWHNATVTRQRRELLNNHRSILLWFTGFSGSGKSTIAHSVEEKLHQTGHRTFVLDGDNVRHKLCSDLGFSDITTIIQESVPLTTYKLMEMKIKEKMV